MAVDWKRVLSFCCFFCAVFVNCELSESGYYYDRPQKVFVEGEEENYIGIINDVQQVSSINTTELRSHLSNTCGASFSTPTFLLTSPFPTEYSRNDYCSYEIQAFSPRVCQMELNFLNFDINCNGDSLTVSGDKLCGRITGKRRFKFTKPRDLIEFYRSNNSPLTTGFNIEVRQIECTPTLPSCGGVFDKPQFTIESPNYPELYPHNTNCVYVVRASSQNICSVDLFLEDFSLESSTNCVKDRVEIGDRKVLCGRRKEVLRLSDFQGELRIKFISDDTVRDRGFKILVTQIPCGSELEVLSKPRISPSQRHQVPIYPPYPITPVFPPIYPQNQIPPYPITPTFPPIYPPPVPPFPITPTFPPIPPPPYLPECCNQQYTGHNFFLSSPNFPHNPHGNIDCIYRIRKHSPKACGIRLQFRYFWVGEDSRGCYGNWLEIDGQRFCGCKSGFVMRIGFEPWESVKLVRYKTGVGIGKNSLQGYVIEIMQEECFGRLSRSLNNNVTIDDNYRQTRSNFDDGINDTIIFPINSSQFDAFDEMSKDLKTNSIKEDVTLIKSEDANAQQIEKSDENFPLNEVKSNLSNHRLSNISVNLNGTEIKTIEKILDRTFEDPFLSISPPIFPAENFTTQTFSTVSPSLIPNKISLTSASDPPSTLTTSISEGSTLVNLQQSSVSFAPKNDRFIQPSCFAAGFHQWITLAKQYLWSGIATCPGQAQVRPPDHRCLVLDQMRGGIQSPGYPRQYPNNLNQCYSFRRLPGVCKIELTFQDFALEYSKHCYKDYLLVNGNRRYCGVALTGTTAVFDVSRTNFANIIFVTDKYTQSRGFRGFYRQLPCTPLPPFPPQPPLPPSPICSRVFTEPEFELTHVNNGLGQPCVFTVVAFRPDVFELQILFANFNLVCGLEYLIIGGIEFCGQLNGQARNIPFRGREMEIIYMSSLDGAGRGFQIYAKQLLTPFSMNFPPARISKEKRSSSELPTNTTE